MSDFSSYLSQLGLEDSEIKTYVALLQGAHSVPDIINLTNQKRPTVYYALQNLKQRGLVSSSGQVRGAQFQAEPKERLITLADQQAQEAWALKKNLAREVQLIEQNDLNLDKPSVSFYDGLIAVKNVISESNYCRSKKIFVIAPNDNFFWQVGDDYIHSYSHERHAQGVSVKSLWEEEISKQLFASAYSKEDEVRILPKIMRGSFASTILMYDNTVLYISSKYNHYCLRVQSKEHFATMQALFNGLWLSSKPHSR